MVLLWDSSVLPLENMESCAVVHENRFDFDAGLQSGLQNTHSVQYLARTSRSLLLLNNFWMSVSLHEIRWGHCWVWSLDFLTVRNMENIISLIHISLKCKYIFLKTKIRRHLFDLHLWWRDWRQHDVTGVTDSWICLRICFMPREQVGFWAKLPYLILLYSWLLKSKCQSLTYCLCTSTHTGWSGGLLCC